MLHFFWHFMIFCKLAKLRRHPVMVVPLYGVPTSSFGKIQALIWWNFVFVILRLTNVVRVALLQYQPVRLPIVPFVHFP